MASVLVPCPHCHCHAKSTEVTCPTCGEPLRRSDGSVPRTTVAVLLGLTAAGAFAGACSSSSVTAASSMSTGSGGNTGTSSSTGTGGNVTAVFYGPAMTTSSSSGGGSDGGSSDGGSSDGG